jgi:hypothetical protein
MIGDRPPVLGRIAPNRIGIGSRSAMGSLASGEGLSSAAGLGVAAGPHAASMIAITPIHAIHDIQPLPESRLKFIIHSSMTLVVPTSSV